VAQIWIRSDAGDWQPTALATDTCVLTVAGPSSIDAAHDAPAAAAPSVLLRRVAGTSDETWALLAHPSAHLLVNGLHSPLGIVILSDRDEIRWAATDDPSIPPAAALFFSTERLAAVAPYPVDGRRGSCPRCKQPLAAGEAAVRCPACGLWHHATETLPCWTYGEHCAACQQPTSLDAGFRWTPEDL